MRLRLGALPGGAGWAQLSGIGAIAGIGFTVSLFIAGLAFPTAGLDAAARIGNLAVSLLATDIRIRQGRRSNPSDYTVRCGVSVAKASERSATRTETPSWRAARRTR